MDKGMKSRCLSTEDVIALEKERDVLRNQLSRAIGLLKEDCQVFAAEETCWRLDTTPDAVCCDDCEYAKLRKEVGE